MALTLKGPTVGQFDPVEAGGAGQQVNPEDGVQDGGLSQRHDGRRVDAAASARRLRSAAQSARHRSPRD